MLAEADEPRPPEGRGMLLDASMCARADSEPAIAGGSVADISSWRRALNGGCGVMDDWSYEPYALESAERGVGAPPGGGMPAYLLAGTPMRGMYGLEAWASRPVPLDTRPAGSMSGSRIFHNRHTQEPSARVQK